MIIYEYLAILAGAAMGYWIFGRIGSVILTDLYQLYYSTSAKRFEVIYNVTEENYDTLNTIFKLKAKHSEYVEAMRVFEEIARDEVNARIKKELGIMGGYFLRLLPYVVVAGILFLPVWAFYLVGVVGGFLIILAFKLVKGRIDGAFSTFACFCIAETAYSHSYRGSFTKPLRKTKKDSKVV